MEVVAYDPFVSPQAAELLNVRLLDLPELLGACDFVTLHSVLTPETRHLIGRETLARAKPGSGSSTPPAAN